MASQGNNFLACSDFRRSGYSIKAETYMDVQCYYYGERKHCIICNKYLENRIERRSCFGYWKMYWKWRYLSEKGDGRLTKLLRITNIAIDDGFERHRLRVFCQLLKDEMKFFVSHSIPLVVADSPSSLYGTKMIVNEMKWRHIITRKELHKCDPWMTSSTIIGKDLHIYNYREAWHLIKVQ